MTASAAPKISDQSCIRGGMCFKSISNRNSLGSFEKGVSSESSAVNKLRSIGYTILGRRVKTQYGEVDILAKKGKELIAAEVKQRRTLDCARSCLTMRQMSRIANALMLLISQLDEQGEQFESYRVDVLCLDSAGRIEHIENAFAIEDFVKC
jgi:putative endonuclease